MVKSIIMTKSSCAIFSKMRRIAFMKNTINANPTKRSFMFLKREYDAKETIINKADSPAIKIDRNSKISSILASPEVK